MYVAGGMRNTQYSYLALMMRINLPGPGARGQGSGELAAQNWAT